MATFLIAHKALDPLEGGYGNSPTDKGGETIFGIARNYHPEWEGWPILDILKTQPDFPNCANHNPQLISMAGRFIKEHFWDPMRLDDFASQELANYLYEGVVNFGFGSDVNPRIPHWLQEALNELGALISVDGKIGPTTLAALKAVAGTRVTQQFVIYAIEHRRVKHRLKRFKEDKTQLEKAVSWLSRDTRTPC